MATIAGEIHFSSAYVEHDVTDISQAADEGCAYYGLSPPVAVGDKLAISGTDVIIDDQGFIDTPGSSVGVTVWDATDAAWGATATLHLIGAGGGAFLHRRRRR
jgi:hypothetical protein